MNNSHYLLTSIKREIPIEILNLVFMDFNRANTLPRSLDYEIKKNILHEWVLADCNLVGGIQAIVDITGIRREETKGGLLIYVGFGPTSGKLITSVLSIGYGYSSYFALAPGISSALTEPTQTSDTRIELVGENLVYVEGFVGINITNLRCVLENDKDFNNISPRSLVKLAHMAVLATKAYIYNKARVKFGTATIINGIDMPQIIDTVNSYSDSMEMYRDMLVNVWTKINIMNDRISRNRLVRLVMPK